MNKEVLWLLAEMGQMPHLKLNGAFCFDFDDIQAWIKGCKKETATGYNVISKLEARRGGQKR